MSKRPKPVFVNVPDGIEPPPGYWLFTFLCEGEPDPGTVRMFVPGEMLPDLPRLWPDVDIDADTYARALAQYELERQRA